MDSLFETLKNIGAGRLALMLFTFFGLIVFFIYIAVRSSEPGMTVLYSNLSTSDATEISAKLSVSRIAHKLNKDGTAVMVSQKEIGKARILLAQEGLPHQGTIGYEIFDKKQSFGTTSFVQNINKVRALEGELARTIGTINSIRNARVHLVIPQRKIFSRESNPASASVFINLRNNTSIDKGQLQAIQHLVAASVPMLKSKNVVIVDQGGNLLAKGADDDDADSTSSRTGEEMRIKYEHKISRSIENILGRIVGYGRVRAEVTADMNFDVTNINAEIYDPEGQVVRSTQTTTEENIDNTASSGGNNNTVSVKNNLPGLPAVSGRGGAILGSKNNRTEEVTNFEISKKIENTVRSTGKINKISVAVLIDGSYEDDTSIEKPKDADENWHPPKKYVPRSESELEKISALVKSSIGFDEFRGDTLEVINMRFAQEIISGDLAKDTGTIMGFQKTDLLKVSETITLSIVAVLVIMLVLKPLAVHIVSTSSRTAKNEGATLAEENALLTGRSGQQAQLSAPGGGGNEESTTLDNMIDMSSVEGKVKASSVQKISELVSNHPNETVAVIRSWMAQEG